MTNYSHAYHNAATGETTIVDFTKAETDALKVEAEAQADTQAAKAAAQQAVLDRLGLSAAEVQLLLGA